MAEQENMAQPGPKLRKFDVKAMRRDPMVFVIAKRRTGKSVLIADLLYHRDPFPCGIAVSSTERFNPVYSKFMPKMFIYDEFSPELISNVIKRQIFIKNQFDKEVAKTGSSNLDTRTFVVLDDCLHAWTRDVGLRFLFMNGRCIRTSCFMTVPYAMPVPPNLRSNIDYVFIFREPILGNRELIWRQYAKAIFPDFDSFCQVMDQCTQNYECLVIDNTSCSSKIEDQVFWYKAEMHPEFNLISTPASSPPSF